MSRITIVLLCALGLALDGPAVAAPGAPVDSKAWEGVHTVGPALPVDVEALLAKRLVLDEMARGLRPVVGLSIAAPGVVRPQPAARVTVRPLSGVELAAAEARIRAKRAEVARTARASRWLAPSIPFPPKPPELTTSVPLTGDELVRSLAREREKAAPPVSVTAARSAPGVPRPGLREEWRRVPATSVPDTPLNDEQRAKHDAARSGAALTPQNRP